MVQNDNNNLHEVYQVVRSNSQHLVKYSETSRRTEATTTPQNAKEADPFANLLSYSQPAKKVDKKDPHLKFLIQTIRDRKNG